MTDIGQATKTPNTVLVVDDEPDIADQIARHLEFLGFEVDTAESSEAALEKMARSDYRIVITDIQMPGMPGDELIKEIKRRDGSVQVIVMSGHVRMMRLVRCLRLGACDCFAKPIDLNELAASVKAAHERINRWAVMMKQCHAGATIKSI